MPTDRDQIIAEARSWLGIRFRHQGRSRVHGVDCAGLVIMVAKALELSKFDIANYRQEPDRDKFVAHFRTNMAERPVGDRERGDVLLLRDRRFTCHAAILDVVNGQERLIHAFALRRRVVDELYGNDWPSRTTHCFTYPGVEA